MKKVFLALSLTVFTASVALNSYAAVNSTSVVKCDKEKDKKKKCKSKSNCCASKEANKSTEKKSCCSKEKASCEKKESK